MSDKTKRNVRFIYSAILSLMLIISGILLMVACVNVYRIGDRPFTTENITGEFAKIAVVIWITLGMVVAGAIIALLIPSERERLRATVDKKEILRRLCASLDKESLTAEVAEKISKEENLRRILRMATLTIINLAAIPAVIYAVNKSNFTADYNASVIAACTLILPLSFVGMGVAIAHLFAEAASVERELVLVRTAMAASRQRTAVPTKAQRPESRKITSYARIIVAVLALLLIILGICNGGVSDVLSKAINICTECIGLG